MPTKKMLIFPPRGISSQRHHLRCHRGLQAAYIAAGNALTSIALAVNLNPTETIGISGTKTTGNALTFNFYDAGLTGGTEAVSYTVASADTLTTIATGIKTAINADTNLKNLGITATSSGTVVTVTSNSTNITTYRASISSGSTEIITLGIPVNGVQTALVAGTVTAGNVLTITVFDAGLEVVPEKWATS
jgi:phage tail sheath gpL-like